jgi:penicillin-binding protein 1C
VTEHLLEGTQPTERCTLHQRIALDRGSGLRATADTPPDRIVTRVYTILPPEAQEWGREQGIAEPPPTDAASGLPGVGSAALAQLPASKVQDSGLKMSSPDAGAIYRLDPGLPAEAQRIEVSAWPVSSLPLREVTLLVDGQPLSRLGGPPYKALWQLSPGLHVFSARGVAADGTLVASNDVHVEVRE